MLVLYSLIRYKESTTNDHIHKNTDRYSCSVMKPETVAVDQTQNMGILLYVSFIVSKVIQIPFTHKQVHRNSSTMAVIRATFVFDYCIY